MSNDPIDWDDIDRRMGIYTNAKQAKVVTPEQAKRKHEEADLHLAYCKWIKLQFPKLKFIRHEREKARSPFLQNLMKIYHSLDAMPDFEALNPAGNYHGFLLEFKKPGEKWLLKDGKTVKPQYTHQYKCHLQLWELGRVAYFCNDLEDAQRKLIAYRSGNPEPMQEYNFELR